MKTPLELSTRYGNLTVFPLRKKGGAQSLVYCICDCGKECWSEPRKLVRGTRINCGCARPSRRKQIRHVDHDLYCVWSSLRDRCNNPNNSAYKNYGGRGIWVCQEWDDFERFASDMGERPLNYTIDRIDNNGPYSLDNCKWSSRSEQNRNLRRNVIYTYRGVDMCAADLAKISPVHAETIKARVKKGWSVEDAVNTPKTR